MIAPGLGLEAAVAGLPRRHVRGDPVAEPGVLAHEAAFFVLGVIPLVDPFPVLQKSY
jgi:hypothetical protein